MTRTAKAADEEASAEKLEAAAAEGEVQIYKYKALHLYSVIGHKLITAVGWLVSGLRTCAF